MSRGLNWTYPLLAIERQPPNDLEGKLYCVAPATSEERGQYLVLFQSERTINHYLSRLVSSGPTHIVPIATRDQLNSLLQTSSFSGIQGLIIDPPSPRDALTWERVERHELLDKSPADAN